MMKRRNGPTWKKGQVSLPPVYHPPQELADPEAHLTEEQKKWPVVGDWASPTEKAPTTAAVDPPGETPKPAA